MVALMWAGIARYMLLHGHIWLVGWSPRSSCGPECLPRVGGPRVGAFLVVLRLLRAFGVLLCGAPLAWVSGCCPCAFGGA